MSYFNIDNSLNLQRGLMDPLNGVPPQYILNLKPSDAQLKQNKNQQFIEGPDVRAFGGYHIPNIKNEKEYLTNIINKNDEMTQMDSTLFGGPQDYFGVMDPDLENRLLKEDIDNKKMNYMGLDASDYLGDLHDSEMNLYRFTNQVSLLDTDKKTDNVLTAIKALNSGTHRLKSARGIPPATLELFENILLNPDSTDNEKLRDIMRYTPDVGNNINDFLQKNNTKTEDEYVNNNSTTFEDEPVEPPVPPPVNNATNNSQSEYTNTTNATNATKAEDFDIIKEIAKSQGYDIDNLTFKQAESFLKDQGYDIRGAVNEWKTFAEDQGVDFAGITKNLKKWAKKEGMKFVKKEGIKLAKQFMKGSL